MRSFGLSTLILACGVALFAAAPQDNSTYSRKLYAAIAAVESDNGETSGNIYQIQPSYVADVNRVQAKLERVDGINRRRFALADVYDKTASEQMMAVYWDYYTKRTGRADAKTLAMLHRVGLRGLTTKRRTAEAYWARVSKAMTAK